MNITKTILILAANPEDTTRLRLDKEVSEIEDGLRGAKNRQQFVIQKKGAVNTTALRRALLDFEPQIVHFCGHGEHDGIILEDENGNSQIVKPEALSGLFKECAERVECVILNACYSEIQAAAISKHIRYVIGMKREIGDEAAIKFAIGFYDGLGAGKSIEQCFNLGCNAIQLENLPEHLTPILKKRPDSPSAKKPESQSQILKQEAIRPIPHEIVEGIKNGKCILFLGAMASSPSPEGSRLKYEKAPPSAAELSQRLTERCGYQGPDKTNLQRVALFYQFRSGGSRQSLVKAIREEITEYEETTGAGGPRKRRFVPSPILNMLAALRFPIVITTNYDHLFDQALRGAKTEDGITKDPLVRIYDPTRNGQLEEVPLDPTEQEPILLKLHGDIDKPESIVITEEDYIVFIQRMGDIHLHPIHENIRVRMRSWPILFLGYSFKDYNLRLLFRTLRWHLDVANFPLSFSVDPSPDDLIVSVWQHGEKPIVSFIREDVWNFIPALYTACKGKEYQP